METVTLHEEGLFMGVSKRLRFEVLRRDGFRCRYCGAGAVAATLEADHVTPVALGGTDDLDNLATSCGPCNDGKASTAPDDWVKTALEATAATADAIGGHQLKRIAWGLLVDYTPREVAEPVSDATADHAMRNTLGLWFYGWDEPGPDSKGERPTSQQVAEFEASVASVLRRGYSGPVLHAAAQAAGWDRATAINAHLAAVQAAVTAELGRLK